MALTAGIVGLPNVGKSTLFNAITKAGAEVANYPFATIKPNVGTVAVPDPRLKRIQQIVPAKKLTPTTFEFTDIAGIVKGAHKGEGLGNKFLENIRQTDAIVHVVRAFDDDNITSVTGKVDPLADISTINLELSIADLDAVNKRLGKVKRAAKGNKHARAELAVLKKIKPVLEKGGAVRSIPFDKDEQKIVKGEFLLTAKPVIYVANIGEDYMAHPEKSKYYRQVKKYADEHHAQALGIACEAEEQIAQLGGKDQLEFLKTEGVSEPGLNKLIRASYKMLGLQTFFTVGGKENRAWTYMKGTKAPQAAGKVHSDMERGFIRAEIIHYADLDKYGSEDKVKDAGKLELEGKDYVMHDGDIAYFRFNV